MKNILCSKTRKRTVGSTIATVSCLLNRAVVLLASSSSAASFVTTTTEVSRTFRPLSSRPAVHVQPSAAASSLARLLHRHSCCYYSHRASTTSLNASRKKGKMRGVKKENLPSKVCVVCNRPFTWRKKWEDVWDEVTTCSKSCNRERRNEKQRQNRQRKAEAGEGGIDLSPTELDLEFFRLAISDKADADRSERRSFANLESTDASTDHCAAGTQQEEGEQHELVNTFVGEDEDDPFSSSLVGGENDEVDHSEVTARRRRKEAKKAMKAARRAQREGRGDRSAGRKSCDVCTKSVDMLVRCQIDSTLQWKMVCGRCWHGVSGGVVDGDAAHPYYRYGGLWKNRRKQNQ